MGEGCLRNEPCWCGSGRKFKRCHLGSERIGEPAYHGAVRARLKSFGRKECLHPSAPEDCNGRIVRAHTISRAAGLRHIARDGRVYCFDPGSKRGPGGETVPSLRGIREASAFTGFCQRHDSGLFLPIDNAKLTFTDEQLFLFAYRAVSRELYMKQGLIQHLNWHLRWADQGPDQLEQTRWLDRLADGEHGAQLGGGDLGAHEIMFDELLLQRRFAELESAVFEIDACPLLLSSGAWFPEYDFQGNHLQDLESVERAQAVFTSGVVTEAGSAFILSWLPGHEWPAQFAGSLAALDNSEIPHALVRFLFESCENLYMHPDWWESLDEPTRTALVTRYNASLTAPRSPTALLDDGIRSVDWEIVGRRGRAA
ncbi:MAG: SEC-C domain-containing protein [Chloroflexi bacterium]|nr:SEC-C domain-containing protein [Chloroflexota bacterium]